MNIVELAEAGEFGNVIIDSTLDVKTSCEKTSGNIKGIVSPIDGEADVLIFPNIESGNAFYKAVSLFSHADILGCCKDPHVRWYYRRVAIPVCPNITALPWLA